jgi:hypothetical protein
MFKNISFGIKKFHDITIAGRFFINNWNNINMSPAGVGLLICRPPGAGFDFYVLVIFLLICRPPRAGFDFYVLVIFQFICRPPVSGYLYVARRGRALNDWGIKSINMSPAVGGLYLTVPFSIYIK